MAAAAEREATSLMLVEEIAHRVLNEYTHAIADLNLAARRVDDERTRRHLIDAADRLHAHAHAHRALAMPAGEGRCDVSDYLARVCSALGNALLAQTVLRLKLGTFVAVLSNDRCWRLALIVSELIHNAARHGGPDGKIIVELSVADSQLVCCVSNAGASRSATGPGRGRRVVAALAEELEGHADWLFTPTGACAWVMVPLDGPRANDLQ